MVIRDFKLEVHLQSGGSFNGYLLGFSCGHTIHDSVVSLNHNHNSCIAKECYQLLADQQRQECHYPRILLAGLKCRHTYIPFNIYRVQVYLE